MKTSRRVVLVGLVAVLVCLCSWFARDFLQGGGRVGFIATYIGLIAVAVLALSRLVPESKTALVLGGMVGLIGPALAVLIIVGSEAGILDPEGKIFKSLARMMAVLWYPGNWVSSMLGMEVRLNDLDLTRRAELYEWLRLVPLNAGVYGLLIVGIRVLIARVGMSR